MSWRDVGLKRMLTDWLADPVRRKHVDWRIAETLGGGVTIAALAVASQSYALWAVWTTLPLMEWLLYEFILEPAGLTGPYWERGPADGETFVRW